MLKTGVISVRCVRVATQPLPESLAKNVLPDIVRRCPVIANRHNRAGVLGYLGMFSSPCVANNVSPAYDKRLEVLKAAVLKLYCLGLRNQRPRCSGSKNMVGDSRSRTSSRRRPVLILAQFAHFVERD